MKHLKTIFACVLMTILSIGQVLGATLTYTHDFTTTISSDGDVTLTGITWTASNLSNVGSYNSGNYKGVQIGTSSKTGAITLTSKNNWGAQTSTTYTGYTNVKKVYVWLNNGSGTISATVKVGGTACTKSGTVSKNSSATSQRVGTSQLTFTPASGHTTGAIEIAVSTSSKAGYLCAIQVECEEPGGSEDPTPLSVPTGMSSGTPGTTSATLTWNAVTNADGYALTIGNNTPITTGFTTSNGKVSYALSNLTADTDYTWKVKATTTHTDTYSNSDDCDDQTFTTADDPSYSKVTYDFTNASNYPSGFPTSSGTSTESATDFTFGGNTLKLYAPDAYYQMTSGTSKVLFFGKTTGAYIEFPAKAGYKLIKVKVTNSSACAENVPINIFTTDGTAKSTAVIPLTMVL